MKVRSSDWTGRVIAAVMVVGALALTILTIRILLVPFIAALFLAYLYEPMILRLQRYGFSRSRSFMMLFAVTVVATVLVLMRGPSWLQMESMGGTAEGFSERIQEQLVRMEAAIDTRLPVIRSVDFSRNLSTRGGEMIGRWFDQLPSLATSFAINLLLVPFIAYFLIRDGGNLKRRLVSLVPNRYFETALVVIHRIDRQIGGYMRGRLIESILVGMVQLLGMGIAALFVPQPQILLIASVTAITNLIPYLGPILGAAFGAFLYVGAGLPIESVVALLIVSGVSHLADNFVIAPAVLSNNVDLHPLTVVLVLVIGGETQGVLGLLIAIPVASSVKVIFQEIWLNYQIHAKLE